MTICKGSILSGGITRGGILAGGILASQAGDPYRDYAFYLDSALGFDDQVTDNALSCIISGTRYDIVNNAVASFAQNTPVITAKGIRTVGAYSNYFLNSGAPVTQSIILAAGTYTLSITGSGSVVYNSNTATAGTPATFTLASSTTADCTIIGTVATVMLCQKKYAHPYLPTAGSIVSSPAEAGGSSVGIWIDNVSTNNPLLNTAFTSHGTLTIDWTPGYSAADVSGVPLNILSFNGTTKHISYDPSALAIRLTDGTRTIVNPVPVTANTEYTIKATWNNAASCLQLTVNDVTVEGSFDGSFDAGNDIIFSLGNPELHYIKDFKVYKEPLSLSNTSGLRQYFFDVVNSQTITGQFSTTESITVHWGDGTNTAYNGTAQSYSKTYAVAGNYTVTVVSKSSITNFRMDHSTANIYCDLADLPANLTYFRCQGSNTITGNLSSLPANLTYFICYGSNTITGNLSSLPANLTYFYCTGSNTVTGNLSSLPANLTSFICQGSNTVTGNLSSLPANLTYFYCTGSNTVTDYTTKTWPNNMQRVYITPVSPGGLSSSEIDQLLIDLALVSTWINDKQIYLMGTNAARTSASDAAVTTLQSKGVSVTTK